MLPEKEKHYTFHSQQKMKRTTCCCGSVRIWIVVLIAATALGLVVLSGWPSSLYYGNKADSAVKLQEDFDKAVEHKSHLHKHYHRQSPITHSSNELNEVQSNIVVNNQPDKHPAGTEKSVTEVTEEEETEIKDPKLRAYKEKILTAQDEALQVLESKSGWIHEQGEHKEAEGVVFSKATKWGKVFKLEAILEVKADLLFEDIVYQSEKVPEWNPTMLKVQVLKSIDDSTEISYSLSASAAGGMISSRDFVYLRHWEEEDGWLVTSSISVKYPNAPDGSQYVRGEQRPGIMRMRAVSGGKAELQWLLNSDVKGWVPTSIVNQALAGTLVDYLKSLRAHAAHLG